jgi:WD40 repeat protein
MPLKFLLASCVGLLLLLESNETLVSEDHQTPKDPSLPPGVIARLGSRRFWHDGIIGAIAASSDGKLLATAEAHGRWVPQAGGAFAAERTEALFRLWDARTGQQVGAVSHAGMPTQTLAFSPDNRSLAVASMASLGLYDVSENGEIDLRWDARGTSNFLGSVSFAADGKSLAIYSMFQRELVQLDRLTGKTIRSWKCPEKRDASGKFEQARTALLSPDGRRLVWFMQKHVPAAGNPGAFSMAGERLELVDAANGKELSSKWFPYSVQACFSPNSRLLAVPAELMISIRDTGTGERVSLIRRKQDFSGDLVFAPDSRILVAVDRNSGQINCGNATNGERLATFSIGKSASIAGPMKGPAWVSFSDNSTLWVGQDSRVRRFDVVHGKEITEPTGHSRSVQSLRFSDDGKRLFSASEAESIDWDVGQQKEIRRSPVTGTHAGSATAQAASPDGKLLAGCSHEGVITLKDLETGRLIRAFRDPLVLSKGGHTASLYRLLFSGDSKYLASVLLENPKPPDEVGGSNGIQVWEVAEGREVARITSPLEPDERFAVAGLALSPDHRFLAFGLCGHDGVHLWEVASQTERARFEGQKGVVTSLAFSPASTTLASGAEDGTIWLRDVRRRAGTASTTRARRSDDELTAYWRSLTELDAKKVEQAMQVLIDGGPKSVAVIRRLCKPVTTPPETEIDALIRNLDSEQFALRNRATAELGELGELARPAIEKALEGKPLLEKRQRLQGLLRASRSLAWSRRDLQFWRTIEVLERIGTPEAQAVVRTLAGGATVARVTGEAQACLERMNQRVAGK